MVINFERKTFKKLRIYYEFENLALICPDFQSCMQFFRTKFSKNNSKLVRSK